MKQTISKATHIRFILGTGFAMISMIMAMAAIQFGIGDLLYGAGLIMIIALAVVFIKPKG